MPYPRIFHLVFCLVHLSAQEEHGGDQVTNTPAWSVWSPGPCFAQNTGFVGNPLLNGTRNNNYGSVNTPIKCQALCMSVSGCRWFNWEEDSGNCWLMEFKGRMKDMEKVISGPVECRPSAACIERDVIYIGHPLNRVKMNGTWTNNHGRVSTVEECQRLCSTTVGCKWFNWGSNSLCWLKTGRGPHHMERVEFGTSSGPGVCPNVSKGVFIKSPHFYYKSIK